MADEADVLAPATDTPAQVDTTEVIAATPVAADVVLAGTDAGADTDKAVLPDWRDDWREKMANGDPKELKHLERFASPVDVYKSKREADRKLTAGDLKAKLAADATPEQVTAWRKDNGVPEAPAGYLDALPKGLVIGDDDKSLVDGFLARVHGKNADPAVVSEALGWYYDAQEEALAAQTKADSDYVASSTDSLRAEWGAEFRSNVNSIQSFLDGAPPADDGTPFKTLLLTARLGDGTLLKDNPVALKWLAGLAAAENPTGFVSPGGSGGIDTIDSGIARIEGILRTDRGSYDRDPAMQRQFRQLLEAKERYEKQERQRR